MRKRVTSENTGGKLLVGCARGRWTWRPWRWPGLLLGVLIRLFGALGCGRFAPYSHMFLWYGSTIWEASKTWRRGHISEYGDKSLVVDVYEILQPNGKPLAQWQVRRALEMADAMVGQPYDWYHLIRMAASMLGILHDDIDTYIPTKPLCSEGVALCYYAAAVDIPGAAGTKLWTFAPWHILRLLKRKPPMATLQGRLSLGLN